MDIVVALKSAGTVKSFVETGQLEEAIGSVNLAAALKSTRKLPVARDPRGQIWSSINHLEAAEEAFRRIEQRPAIAWVNTRRYASACFSRVYAFCLLAVCYRYVGESELSRQSLDAAEDLYDRTCVDLDAEGGQLLPGRQDDPWWWRKWRRGMAQAVTNIPSHLINDLRDNPPALVKVDPHDVRLQLDGM
jgi:hypothetical protein